MSDPSTRERVSQLAAAAEVNHQAAADLVPIVYQELRNFAGALMAKFPPGTTLQPTALVHEAYLRLVGDQDPGWEGRRHFFGAAARAMRQVLIERARRKRSHKGGGGLVREDIDIVDIRIDPPIEEVLSLDEAMRSLERVDPRAAKVAELRYFAGMSVAEVASVLGIGTRTAERDWAFARAMLADIMRDGTGQGEVA